MPTIKACLGLFISTCFLYPAAAQTWPEKIEAHYREKPGGKLILEAMDAHGGLAHYLEQGVLQFRWTYHMRDRGPEAMVDTIQQVDPHSLQARHKVPGSPIEFGWNGYQAWVSPPDAAYTPPPRFWALTPYYFVAIPFVFADLTTRTELLDDMVFEGENYHQVKITYAAGSGDAPDDYYILLIHPETKVVVGTRYIVTHPLVAKDGPLPEKLITLEKFKKVNGILIPMYHRSFKMKGGKPGEKIREAFTADPSFLDPAEVDFTPPKNHRLI